MAFLVLTCNMCLMSFFDLPFNKEAKFSLSILIQFFLPNLHILKFSTKKEKENVNKGMYYIHCSGNHLTTRFRMKQTVNGREGEEKALGG